VCGDRAILNVARYLKEVHRVLKTGSCYVLISLAPPEKRLHHLKRQHLNFEVTIEKVKFGSKAVHYVYICRKMVEASE
jgi:ubiquinone/menaquinone biosynthesis C-methylase UbiE